MRGIKMFEELGKLIAVLVNIAMFVFAVILIVSIGELISWLLGYFLELNISSAIVIGFAICIFIYEKIRRI